VSLLFVKSVFVGCEKARDCNEMMNLKAKGSKHLIQFVNVCLTRREGEGVLVFALSSFLREPCALNIHNLTSTFSSGAMFLTLSST
jgi:hypothetical protein